MSCLPAGAGGWRGLGVATQRELGDNSLEEGIDRGAIANTPAVKGCHTVQMELPHSRAEINLRGVISVVVGPAVPLSND